MSLATDLLCEDLQRENEELRVQMLFWKQAAEHAVEGWLKQEDVSAELRVKLVEACGLALWSGKTHAQYARIIKLRNEAEELEDAPDAT